MATEFDPIKALREEIAGLAEVHRVILARTHESERQLAEEEANHNAFLKMEAFMKDILAGKRAQLKALEDEQERKLQEETK